VHNYNIALRKWFELAITEKQATADTSCRKRFQSKVRNAPTVSSFRSGELLLCRQASQNIETNHLLANLHFTRSPCTVILHVPSLISIVDGAKRVK